VIFMTAGLLMMYKNYGDFYGNITLIVTIALTASCLIYALKSKAWRRFGLKDTIDSKVIDLPSQDIAAGTVAVTSSALRPMGTVIIGITKYEAQTTGAYIESNTEVVVLKVMTNKLLVELKS